MVKYFCYVLIEILLQSSLMNFSNSDLFLRFITIPPINLHFYHKVSIGFTLGNCKCHGKVLTVLFSVHSVLNEVWEQYLVGLKIFTHSEILNQTFQITLNNIINNWCKMSVKIKYEKTSWMLKFCIYILIFPYITWAFSKQLNIKRKVITILLQKMLQSIPNILTVNRKLKNITEQINVICIWNIEK